MPQKIVSRSLVLALAASIVACSSGSSAPPTSSSALAPSTPSDASGQGPQAAGGASRASGSSVESELVDRHNRVRAQVGTKPLVWSATAASVAKAYAERCEWGHNPNNTELGENLFASSGSAGPDEVVASWAAERKFYDPKTGRCAGGECGHYTQVVWSATTGVGCAMASCTKNNPFGSGSWTYWVCDYEPAGNYTNQKAY